MTLDEIAEYIATQYDAESGPFFTEDRTVTVFMRADNKKWFAATKNIGCRFIGIGDSGRIDILNVRLDPREVASLRTREGFLPAWKMNQNSWITIPLDGRVPDDEVFACLDSGFRSAGVKGKKR